MDLLSQFNDILKLACEWASEQEASILKNGHSLLPQLLLDAKEIGVIYPNKVRILIVSEIPRPNQPLLKEACMQTNFLNSNTIGLTLNYGIYVRSDYISHRETYIHELAHVAQYEKLGDMQPFLQKYLFEIITKGYLSASMEQEAIEIVKKICNQTHIY